MSTEDTDCTEDGQVLSDSDLLNTKYHCAAPLPTSMTFPLSPASQQDTHQQTQALLDMEASKIITVSIYRPSACVQFP